MHRLLLLILARALCRYLVSNLLLLLAGEIFIVLELIHQLVDLLLRLKVISVRVCQLATSLPGLGGLRILCHIVWILSRLGCPLLRLASSVFRRSRGTRGPSRVLLFHLCGCFGSLLLLLPLGFLGALIILGGCMSLIVNRGHLAGVAHSRADGPELRLGEVCVVVEPGGLWHDVAECRLSHLDLDTCIVKNRVRGETHAQTDER